MLRVVGIAAGLLMAAAVGGCATAKKPESKLEIAIGPDGTMTVVMPENGSSDEIAMAMLMQAALDGEPGNGDEADAEPLSEAEVWSKDPDDNLIHIQSGVTCPAVWAGMQRTLAQIFRDDGTDVGCNYGKRDSATVMTFYAFAAHGDPASVTDLANETMEAIKMRQPLAKETPYLAKSNAQYEALTLAYENADGSKMRTSLLLTKVGDWFLKIRLTCRTEDALIAEETAGIAIIGQADRLKNPSVKKTARPDPV